MTNSLTTMEMQYNNRLAKRTSLQEPAQGTLEHQGAPSCDLGKNSVVANNCDDDSLCVQGEC
jgi:hypothetical protein